MNRRVLLTGAGGLIGRAIGPLLPTGWDLVRTDLHASVQRPDPDAISAAERAAWLSPRDAAELIRAAVEAEDVEFVVAAGTSANRHRRADLEDTIRRLGYRPRDDAW